MINSVYVSVCVCVCVCVYVCMCVCNENHVYKTVAATRASFEEFVIQLTLLVSGLELFYSIGSPKFITRPIEASSVPLGGSITLPCSASAIPEPIITWSRTTYYGIESILESSGNLTIDGNNLTVSNAQYFEDDGNYSCIATNSRGISTAIGRIKVHGKCYVCAIRLYL